MAKIDGKWIEGRLEGKRGAKARLADHLGITADKVSKIVSGVRRLTADETAQVLEFFDGGALVDEPSGAPELVPVYSVFASAGPGAIVTSEEIVDRLAFPPNYLRHVTKSNPRDLAIIGVKGDSMSPTLKDDDLVMIDTGKRDLSYDGLFVIRDGGEALLVKRIGRASKRGYVMIISDNKDNPPVERAGEDVEVVGKVVWAGVKV